MTVAPAEPGPRIVDLAAPGQPSDRGASSLGLVMMLIAATAGATALLVIVLLAADADGAIGPLAMIASLVRLAAHTRAGRSLWRLDGRGPQAVRDYLIVAVLQAVLVAPLIRDQVSLGAAAVVVMTALAWPIAVAVAVARRRLGEPQPVVTLGGERQTAATLLAIGGLVILLPALCAGLVAVITTSFGWLVVAGLLTIPGMVGLFALGAARLGFGDRLDQASSLSALPPAEGGARAGSPKQAGSLNFAAATTRAAWTSSMAGALLALLCLVTLIGVLAIPVVVGCLVVTPWLVALHAMRGDDDALGDRERGGATLALGWLLLAHGLALVSHLPVALLPAGQSADIELPFALSGWVVGSPLVHVALGAVQVWAALELIGGTSRARLATTAFVGIAVVAVGTQWLGHVERLSGALGRAGARVPDDGGRLFMYTLYAGLQLVVPAVTGWVVLRRQRAVATAVIHRQPE